jgi:hypothetical protein
MITEKGKDIIAKYLLGQAPAYASYIAVGSGATPLPADGSLGDYSEKKELDFEMFRVPITSRGYVSENGISKIVLTGELPTEERYEISEVGVYSAGSNPNTAANDSRLLYGFTQNENWEYHSENSVVALPTIYEPLDGGAENNNINQTPPVFQTNVDNRIFTNTNRAERYERCRFLNNVILIAGNDADLIVNEETGRITTNPETFSNHIHLTGVTIDLNKNSPTDEIRVAFSIVNKNGSSIVNPEAVRILIEFSSTDALEEGQFARMEFDIYDGVGHDFETNRYVVLSKKLEDLVTSSAFTWNSVDVVKIYTSVISEGSPSGDFYVALDAIRLENLSASSPLYGLTGYSVIKNTNAETIIKSSNTTNLIEFRFAIDILTGGGSS